MWTKVFEFLPHGHYLQLASVCTGWRALYASTMQLRQAQSQTETAAQAMVASVPLIQWAIANGCKVNSRLLHHAAMFGPLAVVQYVLAIVTDRAQIVSVCTVAAQRGNLEMLQWARDQGLYWNTSTSVAAARRGHLEVLQWAHANGCDWDSSACAAAARGGHLEVLKWARSAGCDWDEETCSSAAAGGHLGILQYARNHGCPWSSMTSYYAAYNGHLQLLQWAHANGCPVIAGLSSPAVLGGHLHVLQRLHDIGCLWDQSNCSSAIATGRLHILQWLRERGCPWEGQGHGIFDHFRWITIAECRIDLLSTAEWAVANGCPCTAKCRS